jgi:hypothetical protein
MVLCPSVKVSCESNGLIETLKTLNVVRLIKSTYLSYHFMSFSSYSFNHIFGGRSMMLMRFWFLVC